MKEIPLELPTAVNSEGVRAGEDLEQPANTLALLTWNAPCQTAEIPVQLASGVPGGNGVSVLQRAAEESEYAPELAEAPEAVQAAILSLNSVVLCLAPFLTPTAMELSMKTWALDAAEP